MRRALKRAADGASLDGTEAAVLLGARGDDLEALLGVAATVRDAHLATEGRAGTFTYSRNAFIPLTRLCRDRCHYCTFATVPSRVPHAFLERDEVVAIAREAARQGCKEALFTLGDRPEARWPQAREWLAARGYGSTLEYLRASAIAVLEETGLLPHLNPGLMSWAELQTLRPVAASMGMMLETTAERLFTDKGGPHYGSPDKDPAVRIRTIVDAGRIGVPFTTGILIGIGETLEERAESLLTLRGLARRYRHIQEIIVQNFRAKPGTAMRAMPDADLHELAATIAVARLLLPSTTSVQAPPNLVGEEFGLIARSGIDDWGGVSPVTPDHVNPERPWPSVDRLAEVTAEAGFALRERLAVYPRFVHAPVGQWLDIRIMPHVTALAGSDGLADETAQAAGQPWQEPDAAVETFGRSELHSRLDTDIVYGDWRELAVPPTTVERLPSDVKRALALAADDPGKLLDHTDAAMALLTADGEALERMVRLADDLRRDVVGDDVTYVVNRNINFSNVCYVGCRFCAFAQRERDADAYRLSIGEVVQRAQEAWAAGATEVCMQGGIDPKLPVTYYPELIRAIKQALPGMHVHAFSPMEIVAVAAKAGVSVRDWLTELRDAGLGTIPGTAAEILDDDVRWILTKGKLPTATWVEVVTTAHELGIRSSSTMMYGHVDQPAHWLTHLRVLAGVQDRTGGFTEFVPLPFIHRNAPIYLAGLARTGPSRRDNRAVHAFARLALHQRIDNIQCSWVKLGDHGTAEILRGGANDLGGTLMEETISRMAGSEHGSARTVQQLHDIAALAGRPARRRNTVYAAMAD